MTAIRILLVDDNEILADAMQRFISQDDRFRWGGWATGRDDLMKLLAQEAPDVILMDVDMPGLDSFELVRELAREVPASKVVMLSGHIRREYADAAVDAGAYGYLSKDEDMSLICDSLVRAHEGQGVLSPLVKRIVSAG
jgi:two-component system response regulator DegU